MTLQPLSWLQIIRLGLVQTALGAIVVLTTTTFNRIMVVELALPAVIPGALVALHYAMQILRPRLGYGADIGGRATPWIVGGMVLLAAGGFSAAVATATMSITLLPGIAIAALSFLLIGIGVGACGTTLLVLLAKRVAPERRASAATIVWTMMIAGFVATTAIVGHLLDPYSPARLVAVAGGVSAAAIIVTLAALRGIEGPLGVTTTAAQRATSPSFFVALNEVWKDPLARRFAIFIFVSMLAYSAPELIIEPFVGAVFGLTPGESTTLASAQHGGTLIGMIFIAVVTGVIGQRRPESLQMWIVGGCVVSASALLGLTTAALSAPTWPLRATVFALGLGNGIYAVAALGSMMALAGSGQKSREGVRMGVWGAAQAIAFGLGGFIGTLAVDIARLLLGLTPLAYAAVFAGEAALFLAAAGLAMRIRTDRKPLSRLDGSVSTSGMSRV